jgi:hypothetical protein
MGIVGASGTGKTVSALRVATGMQRVTGGDVFVVDTEAKRALHYADKWRFRHVHMDAPFSPADYLAAFEHCIKAGAKVIVVDSFSHVWEGAGGVLEMHQAAVDRMAKGDDAKAERVKMAAWIKPKAEHRAMVNAMLQMPVNFVCCLRSKEKLRLERGKEPEKRGWQPIGSDDLTYELTLKCLLMPGSDGVPAHGDDLFGDEKRLIKLPMQFRDIMSGNVQLSEDVGERLARWAAGDSSKDSRPASASIPTTTGNPAPQRGETAALPLAGPDFSVLAPMREWEPLAKWLRENRDALRAMRGKQKADAWQVICAASETVGASPDDASRILA